MREYDRPEDVPYSDVLNFQGTSLGILAERAGEDPEDFITVQAVKDYKRNALYLMSKIGGGGLAIIEEHIFGTPEGTMDQAIAERDAYYEAHKDEFRPKEDYVMLIFARPEGVGTRIQLFIDDTPTWSDAREAIMGPKGRPGEDGRDGTDGRDGEKGDQGIPGPVGNTGPRGRQGPQGSPGIQGIQGPPGPQGKEGSPGLEGEPGERGPAGQGVSGVEIKNNPDHTIELTFSVGDQKLQVVKTGNLQGPKGDQGETGKEGPKGDPGAGLNNRGQWKAGESYKTGDYVFDESSDNADKQTMWICEKDVNGSNAQPKDDHANWIEFHAPAGPQGKDGRDGKDGEDGTQGVDGRSIDRVGIVRNADYTVTLIFYSEGNEVSRVTTQNLRGEAGSGGEGGGAKATLAELLGGDAVTIQVDNDNRGGALRITDKATGRYIQLIPDTTVNIDGRDESVFEVSVDEGRRMYVTSNVTARNAEITESFKVHGDSTFVGAVRAERPQEGGPEGAKEYGDFYNEFNLDKLIDDLNELGELTGMSNRGAWIHGHNYSPGDYVFYTDPATNIRDMYFARGSRPFTSRTNPKDDHANWNALGVLRGPKGKDGVNGRDGVDGTNGENGNPGPPGPQGDSVTKVRIIDNEDYSYGLAFTVNGKELPAVNTGNIRGPQGAPGARGPAGTGLNHKGSWTQNAAYIVGDYVFDTSSDKPENKSMWICKKNINPSVNHPKDDAEHWVEFEAPAGPRGERGENGTNGTDGRAVDGVRMVNNADYTSDLYFSVAGKELDPVKTGVLRGATGEAGKEGPAGKDGPQGKDGATGQKGDAGKSAFDIWKEQGNEGDEKDFLASLISKGDLEPLEGKAEGVLTSKAIITPDSPKQIYLKYVDEAKSIIDIGEDAMDYDYITISLKPTGEGYPYAVSGIFPIKTLKYISDNYKKHGAIKGAFLTDSYLSALCIFPEIEGRGIVTSKLQLLEVLYAGTRPGNLKAPSLITELSLHRVVNPYALFAKGDNGITPHIGADGHWWIGERQTEWIAGSKGEGGTGFVGYFQSKEELVRNHPKGQVGEFALVGAKDWPKEESYGMSVEAFLWRPEDPTKPEGAGEWKGAHLGNPDYSLMISDFLQILPKNDGNDTSSLFLTSKHHDANVSMDISFDKSLDLKFTRGNDECLNVGLDDLTFTPKDNPGGKVYHSGNLDPVSAGRLQDLDIPIKLKPEQHAILSGNYGINANGSCIIGVETLMFEHFMQSPWASDVSIKFPNRQDYDIKQTTHFDSIRVQDGNILFNRAGTDSRVWDSDNLKDPINKAKMQDLDVPIMLKKSMKSVDNKNFGLDARGSSIAWVYDVLMNRPEDADKASDAAVKWPNKSNYHIGNRADFDGIRIDGGQLVLNRGGAKDLLVYSEGSKTQLVRDLEPDFQQRPNQNHPDSDFLVVTRAGGYKDLNEFTTKPRIESLNLDAIHTEFKDFSYNANGTFSEKKPREERVYFMWRDGQWVPVYENNQGWIRICPPGVHNPGR